MCRPLNCTERASCPLDLAWQFIELHRAYMSLAWPDTHCPRAPPLQVVPVLLQLTRGADDLQRRVDMVREATLADLC